MPPPRPALFRAEWHSPVGTLLLVASNTHLWGVWFADQRGIPAWAVDAPTVEPAMHPVLHGAAAQLSAYFKGERLAFDLPLDFAWGTPFQQAVWRALAGIGYGHTVSYRDVALTIERPKAMRAVGAAVGRNPLGIVLPCHRVVGSKGQLTGYTGGLERKAALLALEAQGLATRKTA